MSDKKPVYKNILTLPRMKKMEFSSILINREFYANEISPKDLGISYEEFLSIWEKITDKIKQQVSSNPLGVNLPFFLGELKVNYLPYKIPLVDDVSSQEIGIEVPRLYLNSKGKRASIVWERKKARRFNNILNIYAFEPMQATFRDAVRNALKLTPELFRVGKLKLANKIRN